VAKDSRRKWVASEVEEGVHALLWEYSTEMGMHPTKVIETFIIEGLERVADEAENPGIDFRVFSELRRAMKRERSRSQLERLAWSAQKNADEEAFDALQSLCDEYDNVTVEEIMNAVTDMDRPPIAIQDEGYGITSATVWLQEIMKAKDEYPANVIYSMGGRHGFTAAVLKAAKKSLGYVSIRRGRHWAWAVSANGSGPPGDRKEDQAKKRDAYTSTPDPF